MLGHSTSSQVKASPHSPKVGPAHVQSSWAWSRLVLFRVKDELSWSKPNLIESEQGESNQVGLNPC